MLSRKARIGAGLGFLLGGVLLGPSPGTAGILDASWTAPTTNADGTALTDLALYRIYYGPTNPPCPGSTFLSVPSPTTGPGQNQSVTATLTGLVPGSLYYAAVTAVDATGNESACSTVMGAIARSDFAVSPTGTGTGINNTPSTVTSPGSSPTDTTPAGPSAVTITFDGPAPLGASGDLLSGPFQGIDFGTGQWRWETGYAADATNHIYFDSSAGTSRSFAFSPAPQILTGMQVFALSAGTLTLSDDLGQTLTQTVVPDSMQTVTTGWTRPSTTVTVSFTSGWDLGVDDINYQ